jgi:Flp pilus assembly protein CpaB
MKSVVTLAILIAASFAAGYLTDRILTNSPANRPLATNSVPVLVATCDLNVGTVLSRPEVMLESKAYLPDTLPPGAITNPEDLRGKVLARAISKNMPVTVQDFTTDDALLKLIPPGSLALTIRASSEEGALILPAARVDIIGNIPEAENAEKLVTRVIVKDVVVLAVNTERHGPFSEGGPIHNTVVTVAVTPEQAEKIVAAMQRGPVTPVLRRPGE